VHHKFDKIILANSEKNKVNYRQTFRRYQASLYASATVRRNGCNDDGNASLLLNDDPDCVF